MGKLSSFTHKLRGQMASVMNPQRFDGFGRWLRTGGGALGDLLFPPRCFVCEEDLLSQRSGFCQQCCRDLCSAPGTSCPRCAKPIPMNTHADASGCVLCQSKRLRFQRTMALGIYGGAVRDVVLRMKQSRHESLSLAAGALLAERAMQFLIETPPDIVAPVPMHWLRRLLRGVNSAELLAEVVAKQLRRPLQLSLLRCRRRTEKQGTLLPDERRRNVRGAYAVSRKGHLDGAHVLLVDDVMTTGATMNELARILRRDGAREVSVAVFARGVGFD